MDINSCLICGVVVHPRLIEDHQRWHEMISDVAIKNTQRIDGLTQIVRDLIGDGHGK